MRSNDRILVLEKIDPEAKADMVDPKVFDGKNNLHAVMDTGTCMWHFKLEHGLPPAPLRGRYTNFNTAKEEAEKYFTTKNVRIASVKD